VNVIKNNEFHFVPNTKNVFIMMINYMFFGGGERGGGIFSIFCWYVVVIGGDNMA
jgi:hypothetical protein